MYKIDFSYRILKHTAGATVLSLIIHVSFFAINKIGLYFFVFSFYFKFCIWVTTLSVIKKHATEKDFTTV